MEDKFFQEHIKNPDSGLLVPTSAPGYGAGNKIEKTSNIKGVHLAANDAEALLFSQSNPKILTFYPA